MKHLKKFENFDLGRFSETDKNDQDWTEDIQDIESVEDFEDEDINDEDEDEFEDEDETKDENEMRRRVWGDENIVEKKKINSGFQAFLDKQKAKKEKSNSKDDKGKDDKGKKSEEKEEKIDNKGLSAKQKKLPLAMQKAILKKKK